MSPGCELGSLVRSYNRGARLVNLGHANSKSPSSFEFDDVTKVVRAVASQNSPRPIAQKILLPHLEVTSCDRKDLDFQNRRVCDMRIGSPSSRPAYPGIYVLSAQ